MHLVLTAAALGLAGFDPVGLFALIAAMAMGAKRAGIIALMVSTVVCTVIFGLVPALTLGPAVFKLSRAMRGVSHTVWGPLAAAIGIGLVVWGVLRLVRPSTQHEEGKAPRSIRPRAMALTGVMVALSAFVDPAFYAAIVYATRQHNPFSSALVILVWVLFSHCALMVVGAATLLGLYGPVHRVIETIRTRWSRPIGLLASVALVLAGIFCIAQGIAEWHHHWLLFEDVRQHLRPRRR